MRKRPVSLLSGLLTCGCCGGKYGLIMRDRYGCLNHHRRGTCDNNKTIMREKIEARVLSGAAKKSRCFSAGYDLDSHIAACRRNVRKQLTALHALGFLHSAFFAGDSVRLLPGSSWPQLAAAFKRIEDGCGRDYSR